LGRRARERALRFDISVTAEKYLRLYLALARPMEECVAV
jgi:hypothetical protein